MALQLKFSICQKNNCKILVFKETTGAYNASTNTGGWGAPNPATTDATAWSIVITLPDGTIKTISNPTGLPTTNTAFEYEISAATLFGTGATTLEDGLYTIEYKVTALSVNYTTGPKLESVICSVQCCVTGLFVDVAKAACDCESNQMNSALFAFSLLEGLKAAGDCGNKTKFDNILETLNDLCDTSDNNCGCGCS